ncbi:MAG: pyridoxamine 5'-phosphate oxidase family protein [Solirubrobacteraceae bacterium]
MPDPIALEGEIAEALATAAERGRSSVLAHVAEDGTPRATFRGSVIVRGAQQLALWVRKTDSGLATAVREHPRVALVYYSPDGTSPAYLSIAGSAHVDPSVNDEVYAAIPEIEQQKDPERAGVAILVDVDIVDGAGAAGPFSQRAA